MSHSFHNETKLQFLSERCLVHTEYTLVIYDFSRYLLWVLRSPRKPLMGPYELPFVARLPFKHGAASETHRSRASSSTGRGLFANRRG